MGVEPTTSRLASEVTLLSLSQKFLKEHLKCWLHSFTETTRCQALFLIFLNKSYYLFIINKLQKIKKQLTFGFVSGMMSDIMKNIFERYTKLCASKKEAADSLGKSIRQLRRYILGGNYSKTVKILVELLYKIKKAGL